MNKLKTIKYFVTNVETGVVHSNVIEIPDPAKFFNQEAFVDWAIVDDLASTHNIKYSPDKYDISWEYVNDPILNSVDMTTLESEAEVSHILDSGDRTEYKTGAVRDNREGKGRCDLIPLKYMADIIGYDDDPYRSNSHHLLQYHHDVGKIIRHIYDFQQTREVRFLKHAIDLFIDLGMYDDIFTAFLELSKHYEEGAKKYGEYNWQKGIPLHCYIDSGIRHLLKFARGDKDEPHDRAFIWNMIGAMWTYDNKPELDDYTRDHRPVT